MNLLQLYRRDTKRFCLTFTNKKTREPIDITGATILFTIKKSKEDTDALVTKEVTEHEVIEGEVTNKTSVFLTQEDLDLEPGMYFFRIKYISSVGDVVTIINKRLEILV